jgi:hypothetical protein
VKPEQVAAQRDSDLRVLMLSPAGRRFIRRLLDPMLGSSFVPGAPESTAFNEGRRSIALALLSEVQRVAPQSYALLRREEAEELERLATEVEPDDEG